jgi:hypothetical protein
MRKIIEIVFLISIIQGCCRCDNGYARVPFNDCWNDFIPYKIGEEVKFKTSDSMVKFVVAGIRESTVHQSAAGGDCSQDFSFDTRHVYLESSDVSFYTNLKMGNDVQDLYPTLSFSSLNRGGVQFNFGGYAGASTNYRCDFYLDFIFNHNTSNRRLDSLKIGDFVYKSVFSNGDTSYCYAKSHGWLRFKLEGENYELMR